MRLTCPVMGYQMTFCHRRSLTADTPPGPEAERRVIQHRERSWAQHRCPLVQVLIAHTASDTTSDASDSGPNPSWRRSGSRSQRRNSARRKPRS